MFLLLQFILIGMRRYISVAAAAPAAVREHVVCVYTFWLNNSDDNVAYYGKILGTRT